MSLKLLYVEDNKDLSQTLADKLEPQFKTDVAETCHKGLDLAESFDYDLIILDYFLPDSSGLQFCKRLRKNGNEVMILFLTQNESQKDIIEALQSGADDYLTKPFSFDELQARLNALLRRRPINYTNDKIECGAYCLREKKLELTYKGKPVVLKRKEFLIFEYLMRHYQQIVPRYRLYEHVWDKPYFSSNTVDVHIQRLRRKFQKAFGVQHIETIYGIGYRLSQRNLLEKLA